MNHNRLRGTWEEDPAPIPFPGRHAGTDGAEPQRGSAPRAEATTDSVIEGVERELDRVALRFEDLKNLLAPFNGDDGDDHPSAA